MAALTSARGRPTAVSLMSRARLLPAVAGASVVALLVFRLGAGPLVAGLRVITGDSLAVAIGITVITTVCSAWRWTVVARRLGVELRLRSAVAMYYRAQFLNTTLPGGVLGDVHRAVRQGQDVGDVSRGVRAVVCERLAGQAVQLLVTAIVLVSLPSPLPTQLARALAASFWIVLVAAAVILWFRRNTGAPGAASAWSRVAGASMVVVAGYATMFVVAARLAGVHTSTVRLLPLAMLVLVAMAVPTNIGGWGPREGVAAWLFGLAGLGSSIGLETATVYGVMTIVSCAPGGVVLLAGWLGKRRAAPLPVRSTTPQGWAAAVVPKGGSSG